MSYSNTATETYSVTDIETVMRKVTADIVMIAGSTGAISEEKARQWGHDIEVLAKNGYLKAVDLTLFSGNSEIKAVRYDINTESGALTTSRPGGVLWPRVNQPYLQIILMYTSEYNSEARSKLKPKLCIDWVPTSVDTSHSTLKSNSGRNYVSNAYGMQRKDFN
ncbi:MULTISPECIES: HORMA-1 domain-containing protein [Nitrosomonas]|uniref:Bacterial HORMA domain-containing protein n=1 Tax=Nitrosomonas communis TaxID=44574 RepID=A0A0F7KEC4_9PROT|nr:MULTISPECIES: hypothetical protein [Nitrosomonas]AKH37831.1 hypothetical protein AAW31_08460 [Nitrosomonas communis]TYP92896.1 hypothetical protein BCL69_100597 [Nitrosomonas communis]UVS63181.1 hypothetical protein NX761_08885 [Nitrosomonas sp. PLL12]